MGLPCFGVEWCRTSAHVTYLKLRCKGHGVSLTNNTRIPPHRGTVPICEARALQYSCTETCPGIVMSSGRLLRNKAAMPSLLDVLGWRWKAGQQGGRGDFQKARSSLQDLPGEPEVSGDTLRQDVQVSTQMLHPVQDSKQFSSTSDRCETSSWRTREDQVNCASPAPPTLDQSRELAKASGRPACPCEWKVCHGLVADCETRHAC